MTAPFQGKGEDYDADQKKYDEYCSYPGSCTWNAAVRTGGLRRLSGHGKDTVSV